LLRVDPVPPPSKELIARGRRASYLRLGKCQAEIDAEIAQRRQRFSLSNDNASRSSNDTCRVHETIDLPEGYGNY
jgi:hypothetical protein